MQLIFVTQNGWVAEVMKSCEGDRDVQQILVGIAAKALAALLSISSRMECFDTTGVFIGEQVERSGRSYYGSCMTVLMGDIQVKMLPLIGCHSIFSGRT